MHAYLYIHVYSAILRRGGGGGGGVYEKLGYLVREWCVEYGDHTCTYIQVPRGGGGGGVHLYM